MSNTGLRRARVSAFGTGEARSASPFGNRKSAIGNSSLLLAALIVGATLLAYAPVFRAGFIWDDDIFLTGNPLIRASDGLCRFWFTTAPTDYFPLTSSMLWFEWRLWGPNATGYHLVNVLLHAASAVLLWRVLLRLKVPGAWLAGLLFALHPVAVESVAWITERKNTLPMALYLASIMAWMRFEDCGLRNADCGLVRAQPDPIPIPQSAIRNPQYLLSLALFFLALLAKTSVVILPLVLLGCVWWRRGRITRRDLLRVLPFAALAAALGLVTVWYQYHNAIGAEVVRSDGLAARTAGTGWAVWFYLYKALLPVNLCFVYPRWTTSASLGAFVPGFLFLAMLLLFWRFRRSWGRPFLFALGYFLVALLPVLGFLNIYFMRFSLVADHWQYTALIGVVALVAGLLAWLMERQSGKEIAMACAVALVLTSGALTFRQTFIYHDEETLWRDTLSKNTKAWLAHGNLGALLARQATASGSPSATETGRRDEAMRELDQAIALNPDYDEAYYNRGILYVAANRADEALRDYNKAIELKHNYAEAYCNRGVVRAAVNRHDEALQDYDQAIALKPDFAQAYCDRGILHAAAGRYDKALRDFDQAIALDSNFAQARFNRGNVHASVNRREEALQDYDQAIALKPDFAQAYYARGNIHAASDRNDLAFQDYGKAIALNPDFAEAYCNRGNIRLKNQRPDNAIGDYTRAIEINPAYAEAYLNRAMAWFAMKDYPRALSDVRAAQRLGAQPDPGFLNDLTKAAR